MPRLAWLAPIDCAFTLGLALAFSLFARLPPDVTGRGAARASVLLASWAAGARALLALLPFAPARLVPWQALGPLVATGQVLLDAAVLLFLWPAWQLARRLRAPTVGWLSLAIAGSVLGSVTLSWFWGSSPAAPFAVPYHLLVGTVAPLSLAFGVCLPLRRWLGVRALAVPQPRECDVPELPALARGLRPFGAAVGARWVFAAIAGVAACAKLIVQRGDVTDLFPYFAGADVALGAALLSPILTMRGSRRRALPPLILWALALGLAVAAFDAWRVRCLPSHEVYRAIAAASTLAWLWAAHQLHRALAFGLREGRILPRASWPVSFGPLVLMIGALPFLDLLSFNSRPTTYLIVPTLIVSGKAVRDVLRATVETAYDVDVALEREAQALARETASRA